MERTNKKRKGSSTDDLGSLRTRPGINFSWIYPRTDANHDFGRVYFAGFSICDDFGLHEFMVGDIIKMKTNVLVEASYGIVSVFQATKSFSGLWFGKWSEIQKRGHPYMELKNLDDDKHEILPDWLLDQSLKIEKSDSVECFDVCPPAQNWDEMLKPVQVCYYKKRKRHARKKNLSLRLLCHDGSSDESDCDEIDHDRITDIHTKPLEQLVIHHQGPLFTKRVAGNRSLDKKSQVVSFTKNCMGLDAANKVQTLLMPLSPCSKMIDVFIFDDDMGKKFQVNHILENIKNRFYKVDFHSSQYHVCLEVLKGRHPASEGKMRNDVFFSAPCGFGKSLCFVVAAYALGGITLVVEPLRALISSQIKQLRDIGVNAKQLLARDEAKSPDLPALDFLHVLANQCIKNQASPHGGQQSDSPLIIFSTPEIVKSCGEAIKRLAEKNLISLVVVDEFDYIDGCNGKFRESYLNLVSSLRETLQNGQFPQVPFLFLSATGSSELIFDQLSISTPPASTQSPLPSLFQTSNILPRNHIYRVERKTSLKQAVQRMSGILRDFQGDQNCKGSSFRTRCICYCLTLRNCEKAVNEFRQYGIDAAVFSSRETENEKKSILNLFLTGDVQVLCATSALGRGVHIQCPIHFIVHLVFPASLSEYIQATGRGGRDGQVCHCVLFYSPQDIGSLKNVLKFNEIGEHEKVRLQASLDNVCKYALEGKECRKFLLALDTISFMLDRRAIESSSRLLKYAFCTKSNMCDNCSSELGQSKLKKVEISDVVSDLFLDCPDVWRDDNLDFEQVSKAAIRMKVSAAPQERAVLDLLRATHKGEKAKYSLLSELVEFGKRNYGGFIENIREGRLKFFIQHSKLWEIKAWYDFENVSPLLNQPGCSSSNPTIWPFLIQFESDRLGLDIKDIFATGLPDQLSDACKSLFEKVNQKPASYVEALEKLNPSSSISVSYKAELRKNGNLQLMLLEPERPVDRRIYRMYGSDRFLEISFAPNVSDEDIISFLSSPVAVGDRSFRFFWFKKENGIRAVLFAESGFGLETISVSLVQDRCIPKSSNPALTLGKWVKRMKLNFSDTKVGCKLPPGCVSILDDFNEDGVAEIDGAGLVSAEALSAIWNGFKKSSGHDSETSLCPYSGFQGRLAGFKGIWILDSSLHGFVLKCRKSQLKYSAPMTCVDTTLNEIDDVYEQIEVVSFCRKQETKLNIRVIQILEYYASLALKSKEFEDFLMSCLDETVSEFKDVANGCLQTLKSKLRAMQINFQSNISHDAKILARMAAASVDFNDPEFRRRSTRWLRKQIESIRDKAHYNLVDVVDVRLYPDHTRLLAENEAYLVIDGISCHAKEVIAMRVRLFAKRRCRKVFLTFLKSPSFFPGDMRRLLLIDKSTLQFRANEKNVDCSIFESRNALITSILGSQAEASRMSGGDYDGDRAWVCWNKYLLQCLPASDMFKPEDTSKLFTKPSETEAKLWEECSSVDLIQYMINFRNHHKILGELCENLDCYIDSHGFNNEFTRKLGNAAFLQVDMPFHIYEHAIVLAEKLPKWKCSGKSLKSATETNTILGKMYDKVNAEISSISKNDCLEKARLIPAKISNYLKSHLKDINKEENERIVFMAKNVIESYLKIESNKRSNLSAESFFKWQQEYCYEIRKVFVPDKIFYPNKIPLLHASIIYSQCFKMEKVYAFEFAWLICRDELLEIFSGENRVTVSCENTNIFL